MTDDQEIYALIGEEGFERLIKAFYRQVSGDDVLEPMYPAGDMEGAEQRLRDFLVFRFGGPQRYVAQRGHPRLRIRHAPFAVGLVARDRWMKLMTAALEEAKLPAEADAVLRQFFESTATFMINRVPPALIDLRNISVMRGGNLVLKNLTLTIGAGEHVAILGPNGCGKSTLIKTVTRECYPLADKESSVSILGESFWNVVDLRGMLGIVTNDLMTQCTREITGFDIVLSGFFSSIGIWPNHHVTDRMRGKAHEVLELLDAPHLAEKPVEEMSSGEGRRMLIGRALVHGPKALLLDEPSTSLDLFAQHELRQTVRRLAQSGMGIVLVTHHLSDIVPEIDRVIFMRDGAIVGDGRKQEMLTAERLRGLFGVEVELAQRDGYYHLW